MARLLLAVLVSAAGAHADEPLFRQLAAVPAGFEQLAAPQTAPIDVYYADDPIVTTLATFTTETFEFENLREVLDAIPDLVDSEDVREALSGPLPTHTAELCNRGRTTGCGVLEPSVAAIIFDADRFRANLFVASGYRTPARPEVQRYLPPSDSGFSVVQNITGNFSGSAEGDDRATIGSHSTFAFRENRLVTTANYSDRDHFTIDHLYAQRDFRGRQHVAGLFRTAGRTPSFTGDNDLLGARLASSLDTRSDLRQSRGTQIDVFLAAPGRVDIFRDGRLTSTRFYEAGNQTVDTTDLPEGAYEITLRITEGGRTREETRFFSKTSRLPPRDQPLFTLEAGRVVLPTRDALFPERTGEWLLRGGYSRRMTESFGFDAGAAGVRDTQLIEIGAFQIDALPGAANGYYEMHAGAFSSFQGDHGYAFNGLVRYGRFSMHAEYRHVDRGDAEPLGTDAFSLLPATLRQRGLSAQMPLGTGRLGVIASDNQRADGERHRSIGLNVRYPLARTARGFLEFRGDINRTEGELSAYVGVRYNFWRGGWSGGVAPGYRHADAALGLEDGYLVEGYASLHQPDSRLGDLRYTHTATFGQDLNRLGTGLDWQHFLGRTIAGIEHVERDGAGTTNYSANVTSGFVTNGEHWTFGGQNGSDAAVVIDLDGQAQDTDFEVLVDGYRRGYAPAGRSTAVHLPPYRTYAVRINPRRAGLVEFEDRVEAVTLYPGNVVRLTWEVTDMLVLVGTVEDERGMPLANAVIENLRHTATTNGNGVFQVEVERPGAGAIALTFRDARGRCRASVVDFEERVGVGFLDTLVCYRLETASASQADD